MAEERVQRRLAATAAAVVGHSRLMEQDEAGTRGALKPGARACWSRWLPNIGA
jgi:hypothetical protein